MSQENKRSFSPAIVFLLFLFLTYGCWGTINSFLPVYFNSFGYSNTQIGVLSAVGPFAALFGLLFWGVRTDRARYRNNVLLLICAMLCVSSMLYLLNGSFFYTLAISVVFFFCFYSMNPVGETMFLEQAQKGTFDYGKIRIWGAIGIAALPLLPGLVISNFGIRSLFPSYSALILLAVLVTLMMPKMQGGQNASGKKSNIFAVRQDKEIVGLFIFLFLLHITFGFYYTFFPIYMDNLGAAGFVGLNNLAQFGMEIIIVLFAVKMARRFGFAKLYIVAFSITAARMLLIGVTVSPALLIIINLFGGSGYSMCMLFFSFFLLRAPQELRTSAQTLTSFMSASLPRFFGSLIGGAMSDAIGIPSVFICSGVFSVVLLSGLIIWIRKTKSLRDPVLM